MIPNNQIIEKFNEAIASVQNAFEASKQQDLEKAQKALERSATCIYQAAEWSIKNVLSRRFNDKRRHHNEIKIINGTNFHNKLNLFVDRISPSPVSKNIDTKLISDLKQSVRNGPEHSGFIPHFTSLIKVIQEINKLIITYIDKNAILIKLPEIQSADLPSDISWDEFYKASDEFIKGKHYILLLGPNYSVSEEQLKPLGLIDWTLIFDFNPETETNGLYKNTSTEISSRKKIHLLTSEDPISITPLFTTYWIAANGLKGRSTTLTKNYKEWYKKNHNFLLKFITSYIQSFGDKPMDLVILWDDVPFVQKICEIFYNVGGEKIRFIYAIPDVSKIQAISEIYDGPVVEISLSKIADGILRIRNFFNPNLTKESITLPSKDEEYITLQREDFYWIEENLEIVHRNIVDNFDKKEISIEDRERFYRGEQISWIGLHLHDDIDREKTNNIKKKVERELKDRKTERINVYHYPGIGGTTISRRIAWDFHNDYPVLLLKKYKNLETVNKIYKVFDLTKKTILVIAETSNVNIDEIEKLFNELLSRNFPCILLVIQRNEKRNPEPFYISDILTDLEFTTFLNRYKELSPQRIKELALIERSSERHERHPFYLGLTAFEENFMGLHNYVEKNLTKATVLQKQILSFISLIYYYTQKPLPAQLFTGLLMLSENSVVFIDKFLNNNLLSLLVNEEDIKWRPIHYLVAKELLEQILSDSIKKNTWKNKLPDLAISFIKLISNKSSTPSESEMELLRRLFVYRDNQEVLGKEDDSPFSNFIENGLVSEEARLRIFIELTESFPSVSHFWAHLSRFYSLKMHNHEKAIEAISTAIELSENKDSLLYHMKGMCLSAKARQIMNKWRGDKTCTLETILEIRNIVDESSENFEESREINSSNEHGYISDIQLLISAIDFEYSVSKFENRTDFLRNLNFWAQEKLDLAEGLLDRLKLQSQFLDSNSYLRQCDIRLQELYENYSQVIEGWNNLLSQPGNSKPILRRQIIRAYVRRSNSWHKIERSDIDKILHLIEENIKEDTSNGNDIYLWFQAARQLERIDINTAIDKVSNWRAISDVDESLYYLGVLHSIQAIEGTSVSKQKAEQLIRELSEKKRNSPYRTHCIEWLGIGKGLKKLVPYSLAVNRDSNNDLEYSKDLLEKITGKISFIKGPEAGEVELTCGLKAFFVPARGEGFSRERDLNKNVNFYLGFSQDGLRAHDVCSIK